MKVVDERPALSAALVAMAVQAWLTMMAVVLSWDETTTAAVLGTVGPTVTLGAALFVHRRVSPVAKSERGWS